MFFLTALCSAVTYHLSSVQRQTVARGLLTPIEEKPRSDADADAQQPAETEAGSEQPKKTSSDKKKPDNVEKHVDKQGSQPQTVPIFDYLDNVMTPDSDAIDGSELRDHLLEIEHYLLHQIPLPDRKAYSDCPESSRASVYAIVERQGVELSKSTSVPRRDQKAYEDTVDIFNAADSVFRFFFLPQAKVATVSKYWGALKVLVEVSVQAVPY